MKWYYQAVPGDSWDYDTVQRLTLADITIGGRARKGIMPANKNAYFSVLDRLNGEFLSANPFVPLNWSEAIDKKTGRPFILCSSASLRHLGLPLGIPRSPRPQLCPAG